MPETITVGDWSYQAVWLRATVKGSRKPDLVIVQLDVPGLVERPTFYVDPSIVRTTTALAPNEATEGSVMAFLLEERTDGKWVVQVPGEAVSYGPRLVVPGSLAA